jgi:hypothetical protein
MWNLRFGGKPGMDVKIYARNDDVGIRKKWSLVLARMKNNAC